MRNLIFFIHTSLDGFVAGPKGELNWAKFNNEIFDFVYHDRKGRHCTIRKDNLSIDGKLLANCYNHPNASKHRQTCSLV